MNVDVAVVGGGVAGSSALDGGPRMVQGEGAISLPSGLGRGETRLAFQGGIVEFPRALSRGIDVRLSARVASFSSDRRDIHDSPVLQAISHDSAKREEPRFRAMVYQARPCWSRLHLDAEEAALAGGILHEAARYVGPWAISPLWFQSHRWHHARADGGSELSGPIVLRAGRAARIGFAGDAFAPGGGVQAAWISGRALARRLMGKEPSGTRDTIAG